MAIDTYNSMMTVPEVARLLHVHPNTVRRWADQGLLQTYRITQRGDRRFRREDVDRFLLEENTYPYKHSTEENQSGESDT